MVKEQVIRGIRKYFAMNENETKKWKLVSIGKAVLIQEFMDVIFILKRSQNNSLIFLPKKVEQKNTIYPTN